MTAEAFASLRDLILERNSHALNDCGRLNLQRHLQKLTKAAQRFVARGALQQERIQFLQETNNEAQVRRTARSHVRRRAKMMSYEEIGAASAKREEKEAGNANKQRRGRQHKRKGRKDVYIRHRSPGSSVGPTRADRQLTPSGWDIIWS